jgi:mRNA-degrading endonuclease RelE of RelBE toxin-antitoxin system
VTDAQAQYRAVLTAAALRTLQVIPPRVGEPLVAFIFGSLAEAPRRRGKPLQRELAGRWAARRGDFRIIYRLDDDTNTMYVLMIAHRSDVYRPDRY